MALTLIVTAHKRTTTLSLSSTLHGETGLKDDQIFLFDYSDKMWFDPGSLCWHCVLVKGETGKEGILVDAEGYSYARYAAFASDCDRLRLQDIPVHYEHPARVPEQKKTRKRKEPER